MRFKSADNHRSQVGPIIHGSNLRFPPELFRNPTVVFTTCSFFRSVFMTELYTALRVTVNTYTRQYFT